MATPTLVVHKPDGTQDELELAGDLTIGRADTNDLVLTEGGVSRKHARILLQDGKVLVEDTASANGTWVDGARISRPTPLTASSELKVGDYVLKLKPGGGPARARPARTSAPQPPRPGAPTRTLQKIDRAPAPARPAGRDGGPAPRPAGAIERRPARPARPRAEAPADAGAGGAPVLRGLTGLWANKRFPLGGKVVLGRTVGVDVLLDDESVSRRHAEVSVTGDGIFLKDLGSANGTLLNGEPVTGEVPIQPGDLIQVGMVELVLEDQEALNAPRRRGGPGADRQAASGGSGRGGGVIVLIVILLLAGGGALAFKLIGNPIGGAADVQPPASSGIADQQTMLQEYLSQCRSYSSSDQGDPDWNKAEAACNKALDIDPINQEANSLIKRIKIEAEAYDHYQKAEKAMARLHEEEALEEYARIKSGSQYYLKAKPKLKDAIAGLLKATAFDCKRYIHEGEWAAALPRCEKYVRFVCPGMPREDLVPPPGYAIRFNEGKLRKNEWRPKDPMVRLFLQARQRQDPKAPVWECPPNPMVDVGKSTAGAVDDEVRAILKKLYPEREFSEALFLYWKGLSDESVVKLQKVREDGQKAELHAKADELRKNASQVQQLFKAGESALQQDDALKAAEPFAEAIQVDEQLMKDPILVKEKPSFFRRSIQQEIAEGAYKNGKFWADRTDFRRACRIWKTGYGFYKGNVDLSKAVLFCTNKANEAFDGAGNCEELAKVLELAVDGDGIKEKVDARKGELKCR